MGRSKFNNTFVHTGTGEQNISIGGGIAKQVNIYSTTAPTVNEGMSVETLTEIYQEAQEKLEKLKGNARKKANRKVTSIAAWFEDDEIDKVEIVSQMNSLLLHMHRNGVTITIK